MKTFTTVIFALIFALEAHASLTVFAAASMTDAMKVLAAAYSEKGGEAVRFNFASSGSLARQISAGAPADLFVSANVKWMDWLEQKNLIDSKTRFNLAGNSLVLIESNQHEEYRTRNKEPQNGEGNESLLHSTFLNRNCHSLRSLPSLRASLCLRRSAMPAGRVAVGDFNSVPAGMYAKEALKHMGWLDALKPKLVTGSNVRTVLMYVERGEVAAGIVYASDARVSDQVEIVGTFPADSHDPIVYPAAACSQKESALRFLAFLKTDEAKAILKKYGFTEPQKEN